MLKSWQAQQEKQEGKSCEKKKSPTTNKTSSNPMAEVAKGKSTTTPKSVCGNADEKTPTKTSWQGGVTDRRK